MTLEAVPAPSAQAADDHEVSDSSGRRRWSGLAAALVIAALAFLAFTVVHPAKGISKTTGSSVPASVPAKYQPGLSRLHDAVNGPAR